jgi:hypothetical protein
MSFLFPIFILLPLHPSRRSPVAYRTPVHEIMKNVGNPPRFNSVMALFKAHGQIAGMLTNCLPLVYRNDLLLHLI